MGLSRGRFGPTSDASVEQEPRKASPAPVDPITPGIAPLSAGFRTGRAPTGSALGTGPSLTGRLVDAEDGHPLGGGTIEVWPRSARRVGRSLVRATADAQGRFRVSVPVDGVLDVRARAEGYRSKDLWASTGAGNLSIELEAAGTRLRGHVLSASGPVPGAHVVLRSADTTLETCTEPDGSFELPGWDAAKSEIGWLTAAKQGFGQSSRPLARWDVEEAEDIDLVLTRGRQLWVSCAAADTRAPLPGARVTLCGRGLGSTRLGPAATAGPDGLARLEGIPMGPCSIRVESPHRIATLLEIGAGSGNAPEEVLALLRVGGTVSGRIRGPSGEPLVGVIRFRPLTLPDANWQDVPDARLERSLVMETPGEFSFEGLVPGVEYRGVVEVPGFAPEGLGRQVQILPNETVEVGTIRMRRGRSVRGSVRRRDGTAVAGASLAVRGALGHWLEFFGWRVPPTDAEGSFRVDHLPAGPFWIDVVAGEERAHQRVDPGVTSVEILVDSRVPWTLRSRVVDESGVPVPGQRLVLEEQDPWTDIPRRHEVKSDALGEIEVRDLRAEEVLVRAAAHSGGRLAGGPETFGREDPSRDLVFSPARLLRATTFSGATGEVLAGVLAVWDRLAWGRGVPNTVSGAGGVLQLEIPTEQGTLTLSAPGFRESRVLVPDGAEDLDLGAVDLQPELLLRVKVLSGDGEPVRGVAVSAREDGTGSAEAQGVTDARGLALLVLEKVGEYRVRATSGEAEVTGSIRCAGAGPFALTLRGLSVQPGIPLSVSVLDPDGLPLAAGSKIIVAGQAVLLWADVDAQGRAELSEVPPGVYSVRVDGGEAGLLHASLVVPTGLSSFQAEVRLSR